MLFVSIRGFQKEEEGAFMAVDGWKSFDDTARTVNQDCKQKCFENSKTLYLWLYWVTYT